MGFGFFGLVFGAVFGFVLSQGVNVVQAVDSGSSPSVLKTSLARKLGLSATPQAGQNWTNGLHIVFTPGQDGSLVASTPLRYRDFEAFVQETHFCSSGYAWIHYNTGWESRPGYNWRYIGNNESDDEPVATLDRQEVTAFCDWLTRRERELGWLKPDQSYRAQEEAQGDAPGSHTYRLALRLKS